MDALTVFRTNWIKMSVNILKCMEKYQWTNWLIGYTNKWTILTCSAENSIENSLSHPNTLIYCLNFQRTKQKCDFGRCGMRWQHEECFRFVFSEWMRSHNCIDFGTKTTILTKMTHNWQPNSLQFVQCQSHFVLERT